MDRKGVVSRNREDQELGEKNHVTPRPTRCRDIWMHVRTNRRLSNKLHRVVYRVSGRFPDQTFETSPDELHDPRETKIVDLKIRVVDDPSMDVHAPRFPFQHPAHGFSFLRCAAVRSGCDINSANLNRVGFNFGSRSGCTRLLFPLLGNPLLGCTLYSPRLSRSVLVPASPVIPGFQLPKTPSPTAE